MIYTYIYMYMYTYIYIYLYIFYIYVYIRLPNWNLEEGFPIDGTPWLKMIKSDHATQRTTLNLKLYKVWQCLIIQVQDCHNLGVCTWSANRFTSLHSLHHVSAYPPTLLATVQVIRYTRIFDILWYCDPGWTHKSNWIYIYIYMYIYTCVYLYLYIYICTYSCFDLCI